MQRGENTAAFTRSVNWDRKTDLEMHVLYSYPAFYCVNILSDLALGAKVSSR